jgi:DNA-directed RNA polymerase specialized sigma24 family protein
VTDPFTYVYGVARLVLLEVYKSREKERAALARLGQPTEPSQSSLEPDEESRRLDCLDRCLDELPDESKDLLTTYYDGEKRAKIENRRKLADRLRIPLNALRLRARRVREKLEVCVDGCVRSGAER